MSSFVLPQGMSEADYEAIEAAVNETVRGRWFLGEFARRTRAGELRQVLDAVARLETSMQATQATLPAPADPSVRLLMQRIKEISQQLEHLSHEMRAANADERFTESVEHQARAIGGMLRGGVIGQPAASPVGPARPALESIPPGDLPIPAMAPAAIAAIDPPRSAPGPTVATVAFPSEDLPRAAVLPADAPALAVQAAAPATPGSETRPPAPAAKPGNDPRLALLSGLDNLPLAKKLALFV